MAAGGAAVPAPWTVADQPHEYVGCAQCGTTPTRVVATEDRYGLPTRIVSCVRCGLRYINPRMTAEAYAAFYRGPYRALVGTVTPSARSLTDLAIDQQRYAQDLAHEAAPWMPAQGSLIDVGGSTGIVARHFRSRFGLTPTVIDPSPTELAQAEAKGCQTICGSAETVPFPASDVALLCRTIDHLLDPLGVLKRLRTAARVLVVDAMDVDQWPERWRYKVDHPYAFTRDTFVALVQAAGWTPRHEWTRRNKKYVGLICSPQE